MFKNQFYLILILLSVSTLLVAAGKADKNTQSQIEKIMERMKKPGKELENLARNKLYKDKNFAANANILAKEAKSMTNIKHPDKKFNELSKEMNDFTIKLVEALKKGNFDEIKKNYESLRGICTDCHEAFKN